MKRKFSKILGLGLTLALLASMLVTAAPAAAAPDVTNVWVQLSDYTASATATYSIYFTPGADLTASTDTINVIFPTNTDASGVTANEVTVYPDGDLIATPAGTVAATIIPSAARVTVTTPVALTAGTEVRLDIADVDNPGAGDCTLEVYTSQETTRVTSNSYTIDATSVDGVAFANSFVGPNAEYIVGFNASDTTGGALTALWDKVTVIFPPEVTLPPEGMAATDVAFDGVGNGGYTDLSDAPTISGRSVTITVSEDVLQNAAVLVKFKTSAGIDNPTLAGTTYVGKVYTSGDAEIVDDTGGYAIVAGAISKLAFVTASSDAVVAVSTAAALSVQAQDRYGNPKDPLASITINLSSTSGTGLFEADPSGGDFADETDTLSTSNVCTFQYKDTVAGSPRITAAESPSLEWTDATWDITIETHVVSLYDSNDVLIDTYTTIQAAINAAMAEDTIKVGPGTYPETLDINKQVTLTGVTAAGADNWTVGTAGAGATAPTIAHGSANNFININEADVTIQGFNIDASTFTGMNAGIYWTGTRDSTTIQYCTLNADTNDRLINLSDGAVATNFLITYNAFTISSGWGNWFATGVNAGCNTTNVLSYNSVVGQLTSWLDLGTANQEDITWLNNDMDYGIVLNETSDQSIGNYGDIVVKGNTFAGAPSNQAFEIAITVENADFETDALGPEDVIIYYNDFSGYTTATAGQTVQVGVSSPGGAIDAKYNYWGTALNGPYHATTNPNGTDGDVSDNVTYSPWSHKLYADVVANNAQYPALSAALSVGWNTLSTPAKLISTANTIDDLIPTGMTSGYYFDVNWIALTPTKVLEPCDAVYIKMSSTANVLFLVDGAATSAPTKVLAAGWNLIGLANLTDMDECLAVASVDGSYSHMVSPSMNTSDWIWMYDASPSTVKDMLVGEGYWIFMKEAATIGGFTILPLVPDLD